MCLTISIRFVRQSHTKNRSVTRLGSDHFSDHFPIPTDDQRKRTDDQRMTNGNERIANVFLHFGLLRGEDQEGGLL